jgi:hypothetical protein
LRKLIFKESKYSVLVLPNVRHDGYIARQKAAALL